jgi:DNA-binding transcriptional LysR family regulator
VELRHLRYFIAVAEEKSVTRAAARLGLQQPPLSQQIKALELELGFALFRRLPKGVELTAGGAVFASEARDILARLERATSHAGRAAHGLEGALSIGLTSSAATHPFTPRVLRAFHQTYPGVELTLKDGNAAELTDGVLDRELDLAIIRLPVSHPAGLAFHTLVREEMLAVIPSAHPLAHGAQRATGTSLKALEGEPFILVRRPGAPGLYAELIAACERAGFSPKVAAEVGNMMTNVTLVAAGLGVSVVPASMRGIHAGEVVYLKLAKSARLFAPITLVHRRDDANPAIARFAALARETASSTLSPALSQGRGRKA